MGKDECDGRVSETRVSELATGHDIFLSKPGHGKKYDRVDVGFVGYEWSD